MARATLVRPPTEKITDENGQLTLEWSEKFDELFAYNAEQQNRIDPDTGEQAEPGLSETEVQTLINTSLAGVTVITGEHTEELTSPVAVNTTISHSLSSTAVKSAIHYGNSAPGFAGRIRVIDADSVSLDFGGAPTGDITVYLWTTGAASS